MLTLNLETERHIIKSPEAKAESLGCAMNIAGVDAGGSLVAHVRSAPGPSRTSWPDARWLARALRSAVPALLFGLRLWAAVCLALYIAFWLELDHAYWAASSVAIVCQPSLGASLRRGWFLMVGTAAGAVAIVVLTACFPQDRISFLVGPAFWAAACGLMATLLRNFAAYSAALAGLTAAIAGFTAAIIANDELGANGGANGEVFMLAIRREPRALRRGAGNSQALLEP